MRFLIDEDVDIRIIRVLKKLGHDVRRVPSGTQNGSVIQLARHEHRILITRDSDFTDTKLYPPHRHLGIIHLEIHSPWFEKLVPPLKRLLQSIPEDGFSGNIFSVQENKSHRIFK